MKDDFNQNDIQTHLKWKTISPKMEDNLIQNGRRAYPNWKMTSPKMEDTIPKIEDQLSEHLRVLEVAYFPCGQ